MIYRRLDTIEAGRVNRSQNQICIGVRIAGTQLETRSIRVAQVTDKTGQNRTVTGRLVRTVTQGRNDTYRRFKTGFQTVQGVIGSRYKRIDGFVVLEHAHECTIAYSAHEILILVICRKEVVRLAIAGDCCHANMSVFTVTSQTNHRIRLKAYFKANGTEGFLDHRTDKDFIVGSLQSIGKLPVDF